MRPIWFAILLGVVVAQVTINFHGTVTIANTSTLVTSAYPLNMTFASPINIPTNSYFLLQLSQHFIINSSTVGPCMYHISGATYTTVTCNTNLNTNNAAYEINVVGIYPSPATAQTNVNLLLYILNPMTTGTQRINIKLKSGTTDLASGLITLDYTASPLSGCSYTSSDVTTGAISTRTISFIPTVPVISGSSFVVTLPPWFGDYPSNSAAAENSGAPIPCTGVSNTDSASPTCDSNMGLSTSSSTIYEEFSIKDFVSQDKVLSTPIVFQLSNIYNPFSLAPFGPITFQLKVYDTKADAFVTSQSCTNLYHTATKMNTPMGVQFNINTTLRISTTYFSKMAKVTTRLPFPAVGQVVLSYPSSVQLSFLPNAGLTAVTSTVNQTTNMVFSGAVTSDIVEVGAPISIGGINVVTPPSSRPFNITMTTQWNQGGTVYGIDSDYLTYICQTGAITSVSVSPISMSVNAVTQYTLSFTTTNALTSGSFISVFFPSELTAIVGACSTNNALISCSVANASYAGLSITGVIPGSSSIVVTFPSVKNPKQTQTTSSFKIYSYYDSGLDSMVDRVTSGMTMTSTSNPITIASITPTSLVTYALTTYTIFAVLPDPIPTGGSIKIDFPSTVTFGTVAISSASFSTTACSVVLSSPTVNINSCFSADMTNANISIVLSGIYNPPSTQPTTTFAIKTYGPIGMVDSISSGLIVTMTTPATSTSFTISPLNDRVHTPTQYNLAIGFAVPHQNGDYFVMRIPASMAFAVNPTCMPISGIANANCIVINSTAIKVNLNAVPAASAQISINNIRNYDVATSQSFQLFFYNSGNFEMEVTPAATTTYTPAAMSAPVVSNNDQIALYQSSNISLTITTPFVMDSSFLANQTSLTIIPPTGFSITSNTSCTAATGSCLVINGSIVASGVGLSVSNLIVTIRQITLPYFSPTSSSFSVTYGYAGSQVATISSGVLVSVFCTSPCGRCVSSATACASCLPSPNTAILFHTVNSSCLVTCPNGFYNSTFLCTACSPPCLHCLDATNCTKCTATTYLYGTACLGVCPPTLFGNSSNICDSCVSPCFNCTSASACLSCSINFLTNFTCVPSASCPSGTYGDISTKTCAACSSPCFACSLADNNCTSCAIGFVLHQNKCPNQCPSTFYNNTNICLSCVPPCGNCTSSSACLSCLSDYLSGNSCVAASSCPVGTFPDNGTRTCATCPVGCTNCISLGNCSGCTPVYFFFNFTCLISCPNTTFLSTGNNCVPCSGCQTCQGSATSCTSCIPPLLLSGNSCGGSCPAGTFSNGASCVPCSSVCASCTNTSTSCTSCPNNLFLSGSSCTSVCPTGTFQDVSTGNCSSCNPTCFTCSSLSTICTGCTPSLVLFQGNCTPSCPSNYFNITGNCQTCPNCISCTSVSVCATCNPAFYMYNGVCYSTCPSTGIADPGTMTCTPCNSTCATCSGTPTNCLSCIGGLYLLNSVCFSSCPSGYIATAGECLKSTIGSIIYFPFSITFVVFLIIVIYSKVQHNQTEMVTVLTGALAILVWISWVVLVYQANNTDIQLMDNTRSLILGAGMVGIILSTLLGIIFAVWFRLGFKADNGFNEWASHSNSNLNAYRIVFCMTLVAFPCFRIVYSRLFNSNSLSCFFLKGGQLLSGSAKFAFLYIITCLFPLLFVSGYVIYIKPAYDQTLISSVDSLLLDIFLVIFLIIDTHSKDESFFDSMLENQPYLKRLKYDELNHSLSSIRDGQQSNKPRHKSEIAEKDKEQFFRTKITIIDNLNKFGHLNEPIPELPGHERKTKTLPDDLEKLPQFDINQDQIKVIDDDFFFQEEEKRRRMEEQERLRLQEEQRKRREREAEEQRERRRRLADQDMDEQHQVEFPDLAAIEKVERKGQNMKKSPTHILNNFKKVEDKNISDKDRKKLEEIAKKNGLDPTFMTETFGVEKFHNTELLNGIIDIHNHVDRGAVKALFDPSSNPEVLQEIFSKKSNTDANRLRNILNDPESAQMISKLVSAEDGILAPDVAKLLFDGNSKFSEEFVKQLLMSSKGQTLDPQKLKEMLKECPDKGSREAALKALKKVGGNNLENKALLQNLLGEEAALEPSNFTRVVNDLSKKAVEHLFREKSEKNNTIITKLLNNKKIDLKNLNTILQDPQLIEQLANALGGDNKALQQNLLNLFKNGQQLDPQLLKEFLKKPALLEKLGSQPIDPAFLTSLLKKDAKTDLSLLEKAIAEMTPEQIGRVFEFNPQKNIDFTRVAKLFEYNSKTDPALIAQLLTPEVVENVYNKASTARPQMLNKLVEKGKQVDPEAVLKIYGDDKKAFGETGRIGQGGDRGGGQFGGGMGGMGGLGGKGGFGEVGSRMMDMDNLDGNRLRQLNRKYNNTDNNFNPLKQDFQDELGYKKGVNEINMSRTDGRMLGFLSPIQVGQHRNKKYKNGQGGRGNVNDIDDIDDEEITEYNDGQAGKGEDDDEYEIVEQGGKRKRRKKLKKKPLDDIRLPSEQIYLQRLQAPHQLKKKNIRKKKKKGSSSMQQLQAMDEDNEVYDLDF